MSSFETFLQQLSTTNYTLETLVDFNKVSTNVEKISMKLNQLNYLIGKEDIDQAVKRLYQENKNCFTVLKILVAVRENKQVLSSTNEVLFLDNYFISENKIMEYLHQTGLAEVFQNKSIKNLVDYVFGVEVGLDTNARKNRGGKNMENVVKSTFEKNYIPFEREVKSTHFFELQSLGKDIKKFDFVIRTNKKTYLIEVNYYNGGGSKLNETARSYTDICPKINKLDNFEFVWITDGQGWQSAKNKLEEAFDTIPKLYNLTSINNFVTLLKKEL